MTISKEVVVDLKYVLKRLNEGMPEAEYKAIKGILLYPGMTVEDLITFRWDGEEIRWEVGENGERFLIQN